MTTKPYAQLSPLERDLEQVERIAQELTTAQKVLKETTERLTNGALISCRDYVGRLAELRRRYQISLGTLCTQQRFDLARAVQLEDGIGIHFTDEATWDYIRMVRLALVNKLPPKDRQPMQAESQPLGKAC